MVTMDLGAAVSPHFIIMTQKTDDYRWLEILLNPPVNM